MDENSIEKIRFHKKVWNSVSKIEKYPDMAAEGFKAALKYLFKIVAILTVVVCLGVLYQTNSLIQNGVNYLQNEFPEFSYKDGYLNILSEKEIKISSEESYIGKVIVDTKAEEETTVNKYINEVIENGEGIIVLKDRVIIKNSAVVGTISYSYKDTFEQMGITEFTKQDVINYANSGQIITLYLSLFLTIFMYSFIMYFLTTVSNVVLLSIFGYITTLLARIKVRYVAIFNMSVYAITLSVILNMLYIAVNIFIPFNIQYFQVMYVAVAAIYLVAAILILKTDFIKKQMELMKIQEAEKIVKRELEEDKEKNKNEKEEKEQEENKTNTKEEKNNNKESDKKDSKENKKKETKVNEKKEEKKEQNEHKPKGKKKSGKNKKGTENPETTEPEGANA